MRRPGTVPLCFTLAGLPLLWFAGCQPEADDGAPTPAVTTPTLEPATPTVIADVMPDFSLIDVNTNSATANQSVSPRDYLATISAWYFGNAT